MLLSTCRCWQMLLIYHVGLQEGASIVGEPMLLPALYGLALKGLLVNLLINCRRLLDETKIWFLNIRQFWNRQFWNRFSNTMIWE